MTFALVRSREAQPEPAGRIVPSDDLEACVLLWQRPETRPAALALADRIAAQAATVSKERGK